MLGPRRWCEERVVYLGEDIVYVHSVTPFVYYTLIIPRNEGFIKRGECLKRKAFREERLFDLMCSYVKFCSIARLT